MFRKIADMKIGIYDPYLNTLGGGEKYILTAASCLAKNQEVFLFWNEDNVLSKAEQKFGIDLQNVKFTRNIFEEKMSPLQRERLLRLYGRIIYLSDGSIPFLFSKKLILHFQFPIDWVKLSIKTKLKLSRVRSIICNSSFTKSYIDKTLHVNSSVLYPPVEIKVNKKIKKENIILHVGRFGMTIERSNYKKQDVMIAAFKEMVDRGLKGWTFVLIISLRNEHRENYQKLRDLAGNYPIEFIENPENKKLWEIYSKAKIYWHASGYEEDLAKHPEYAEHFGISTVEAMGAGCVPIVINAGGQREIVQNEKNGFLWDTVLNLQDKTLFVIRNKNIWAEFSQNAKTRAEVFAGDRFCRDIQDVIEK